MLERAVVLTIGILCPVIVLVVVTLVLVLHTACDTNLGRFKFNISASLMKIGTFGMQVESDWRQASALAPGPRVGQAIA
jgi:hypothetical protein